jgi:hypothetical protein
VQQYCGFTVFAPGIALLSVAAIENPCAPGVADAGTSPAWSGKETAYGRR